MSITLYPLVSAWSARGLDDEWRRYLGRGIRLVIVTLSPLAAGAAYVSLPLMRVVFGEEFVGAAFIVAPLVVAGLITTMYELVDIGLRGSGRVGTSFRISATVLAGHILLNVILVPRWGVRGVLVTTLVTATVALILAARRVMPAGVLTRRGTWIIRVITSSFVAFLPLRWITSDDGLMLLAAGGCLIGYAGLLHASGIIDLTRWRTIWTWLRVWDQDTRHEPPTE